MNTFRFHSRSLVQFTGTFLLLACAFSSAVSSTPLLLAKNKTALMPIIISDKASAETKEVAGLLAGYLEKMSGAKFLVKKGNGSTGIVIGTLAEFPNPSLVKPLEIHGLFDGIEAYSIRTEAKRLLLIGVTDKGVSHAAFRLLEELGCRRYFPMPQWEVVPKMSSISVKTNLDDRPVILHRSITAGTGWLTKRPEEFKLWRRFNHMGESFDVYCGHAWPLLYYSYRADFDKHPEYFALVNGTRNTDMNSMQLCVSNPDVQRMEIEWVLNYLQTYPNHYMISVEPNDGAGYCECENCKKLGSKPDQIFWFANLIAREVGKKYPGKMVGLLAYAEHSEPPSFPLEPNIYVQLARGYNWGRYGYDELLDLWTKKTTNLSVYDYYSIWVADWERPPLGLGADITALLADIQQIANHGANAIDAESSTDWGPYGRGYYIANRLMWNPKADVDALLKDFYQGAFGPAAEPMRHWYERFDPGKNPFVCEDTYARAYGDLQQASVLTRDRPDVQARLDHLKAYMQYARLRWRLDHETDKAKKKQLSFDILRHVHRIKDEQLVYSWALLLGWTTSVAQDFNEPTWSGYEPSQPKPYALEGSYTHTEIEQLFQEGLQDFKTSEPLPVRAFSSELVPVKFDTKITDKLWQLSIFGNKYAFYATETEPFELDMATGQIYPNKPIMTWKITDSNNQIIQQGTQALDGKAHRLTFKALKPGLYYLETHTGSGFRVDAVKECPMAMVLTKQTYSFCGLQQPVYFYVPKGTRKFQFFISNALPFDILCADGTVIKHIDSPTEQYVTVDVPAGKDGQPWCLRNLCFSQLWFRNLPNYVAASPNALVIPRELVKSDKLQSPAFTPDAKANAK